jgi:hypothetical protein
MSIKVINLQNKLIMQIRLYVGYMHPALKPSNITYIQYPLLYRKVNVFTFIPLFPVGIKSLSSQLHQKNGLFN